MKAQRCKNRVKNDYACVHIIHTLAVRGKSLGENNIPPRHPSDIVSSSSSSSCLRAYNPCCILYKRVLYTILFFVSSCRRRRRTVGMRDDLLSVRRRRRCRGLNVNHFKYYVPVRRVSLIAFSKSVGARLLSTVGSRRFPRLLSSRIITDDDEDATCPAAIIPE